MPLAGGLFFPEQRLLGILLGAETAAVKVADQKLGIHLILLGGLFCPEKGFFELLEPAVTGGHVVPGIRVTVHRFLTAATECGQGIVS